VGPGPGPGLETPRKKIDLVKKTYINLWLLYKARIDQSDSRAATHRYLEFLRAGKKLRKKIDKKIPVFILAFSI